MNIEYDYSVYDTENEYGEIPMPDDLMVVDELYVLPNGKYLPAGVYTLADGSRLLYEPSIEQLFDK